MLNGNYSLSKNTNLSMTTYLFVIFNCPIRFISNEEVSKHLFKNFFLYYWVKLSNFLLQTSKWSPTQFKKHLGSVTDSIQETLRLDASDYCLIKGNFVRRFYRKKTFWNCPKKKATTGSSEANWVFWNDHYTFMCQLREKT